MGVIPGMRHITRGMHHITLGMIPGMRHVTRGMRHITPGNDPWVHRITLGNDTWDGGMSPVGCVTSPLGMIPGRITSPLGMTHGMGEMAKVDFAF